MFIQANDVVLDDDMPAGFDPDDLDDQMFEQLPPELDPAAELIKDA